MNHKSRTQARGKALTRDLHNQGVGYLRGTMNTLYPLDKIEQERDTSRIIQMVIDIPDKGVLKGCILRGLSIYEDDVRKYMEEKKIPLKMRKALEKDLCVSQEEYEDLIGRTHKKMHNARPPKAFLPHD